MAAVDELPVKGRAPQTGYARDLTGETADSDGCTVLPGTVVDPYAADTIDFTRGQATSTTGLASAAGTLHM